MTELSDDDLMRLVQEGDKGAFDMIFNRYYETLFNYAVMMLKNHHDAGDALQTTFIKVLHNSRRYRCRDYLRAWLLRICRNQCMNILSSRRLRETLMEENRFQMIYSTSPATFIDRLTENEDEVNITKAICELPELQREVMLLYAYEGLKYREISEVLGICINSVKTQIHRARATLAAKVDLFQKKGDNQ